jgi:hypothetical protein
MTIRRFKTESNGEWAGRGVQEVVQHHSAGRTCNISKEHSEEELRSIDRFHKAKDWGLGARAPKIVYHYAYDLLGNVWIINDPNDLTWHTKGHNEYTVGVVALFNGEEYKPTAAEEKRILRSIRKIHNRLFKKYHLYPYDWNPHKHYNPTACCGKYLIPILDKFRKKEV